MDINCWVSSKEGIGTVSFQGSAIFLRTLYCLLSNQLIVLAKEDIVCLYTPRFLFCQFGSVQYCEIGREGVREAHTEADTTTSLSAQQYLGIY